MGREREMGREKDENSTGRKRQLTALKGRPVFGHVSECAMQ